MNHNLHEPSVWPYRLQLPHHLRMTSPLHCCLLNEWLADLHLTQFDYSKEPHDAAQRPLTSRFELEWNVIGRSCFSPSSPYWRSHLPYNKPPPIVHIDTKCRHETRLIARENQSTDRTDRSITSSPVPVEGKKTKLSSHFFREIVTEMDDLVEEKMRHSITSTRCDIH